MFVEKWHQDLFVLLHHLVDDGGEDLANVGQDREGEGDPDDGVHHAE